jgi:zinc transporter
MNIAFQKDTGLICAYEISGGGDVRRIGADAVPAALGRADGFVWLHFNLASAQARAWIAGRDEIPPAAREILLDPDPRPRIEPVADGLVGVISDMHYDFDFDPSEIGTLRLWADGRRVISCRRHPLKAVDRLRKAIEEGRRYGSTGELLAHLVEQLAESLDEVIGRLGDEVDDIEDQILAERFLDNRSRLGKVRRLAVRLRRHIAPQRAAMGRFLQRRPAWFGEEGAMRFRDAADQLGAVVDDLESIQDRAKVLQEEMGTRLSEDTNRNLFVLAVATVVLAPMTLITGIFGMNVGGLPGLGAPSAFWWVMLLILVAGALTLLLMTRRPWSR